MKSLKGCIDTLYNRHKFPKDYDAYAHSWLKRNETAKLIREKLEVLKRGILNPRILDLAAGTGIISCELTDNEFDVTSLDLSVEYLHFLKEKRENIGLVISSMNQPLPFKDESFDGITSMGANRYFTGEGFKQFIGESYRILKNNGRVVFPVNFLSDVSYYRYNHYPNIPFPPTSKNFEKYFKKSGFKTYRDYSSFKKMIPISRERPVIVIADKKCF